MIIKLLTEHHLEFLSLKGGCRGSSFSTLVKMSISCKSHTAAQLYLSPVDFFLKKSAFSKKNNLGSLSKWQTVSFQIRTDVCRH